jgi:hypothetical protein
MFHCAIGSALKSCIIPSLQKKFKKKFDPENVKKLDFFRAAQIFSVLHKGLLMQDWVFRLGIGQIAVVKLDSFFDQRMVRPKKFLDLKENQKVQVVLD